MQIVKPLVDVVTGGCLETAWPGVFGPSEGFLVEAGILRREQR